MPNQNSPDTLALPSALDDIQSMADQNALDRGSLLIQKINSSRLDAVLNIIKDWIQSTIQEEFHNLADETGIQPNALKCLDKARPSIPYPYYFCVPRMLIEHPESIFYYRNLAMLSSKVMRNIGLETESYEDGTAVPSEKTARELATYFNKIVSDLVLQGDITPYRHIMMVTVNIGYIAQF